MFILKPQNPKYSFFSCIRFPQLIAFENSLHTIGRTSEGFSIRFFKITEPRMTVLTSAIEITDLIKDFGSIRALDHLTVTVSSGETFGLIGPNGAGKTTALRIISTLLLPTSGSVKVFDLDVVKDADDIREIITYLPEEAGAYRNLSGWEYLQFMAKFQAKNKQEIQEIVKEAAEICGLGDRLRDKAKTYSKGMKRRLLVARALMTKPKLAILDEPTSGLDVLHSYHVREIIKLYVKEHGVTVLLSSHNMLEVEHLCDRTALVNNGKIVAQGEPQELKATYGSANLEEVFAKVVGFA
jgi:ABC-2 type transport system ATP-binding protein